MTQIAPGVFVSDAEFASDLSRLRRYNISHVLIVAKGCEAHFPDDGITYLIKAIQDTPEQKVFHMFSPCCSFIESARRRGRVVLIHCHAGLSRSVTFAAAYLMAKHRHSAATALELIQERIPDAQPNSGFLQQLARLEAYLAEALPPAPASSSSSSAPGSSFGPPVPTCSSRDASLPTAAGAAELVTIPSQVEKKAQETTALEEKADPVKAQEHITPSGSTHPTEGDQVGGDQVEGETSGIELIPQVLTARYRCKGCRYPLFGVEDIVPHSEDNGYTFAKSRIKMSREIRSNVPCQSFFVEQLAWMDSPPMCGLTEVEGKLHCPKCSARLGGWVWNGAQCSCGHWATPAIQITRSRVDPPLQRPS